MSEKTGVDKPPESPTTARELDFDDDNDAPTTSTHENVTSPPAPSKSPKPGVRFNEEATEIPPPKPPRPVDPQVQAQNTLIEAFPDIDPNVIKAVLVASGGKVEPAFNALLSMSDPNFKAEETPPPQPPRPQPRSQFEQDEIYARQLAEHYQSQGGHGGHGSRQPGEAPRRQQTGLRPNEPEREHSFFDDDLPEIRKNIEQGFKETQKTVNKWITNFTKKLDGEPDEYDEYGNPVPQGRASGQSSQQRQNFGPSQSEQLYGIRKSAEQRRSADHNRYDADNRVLGDDFAQLELRDNDGAGQQRSNRPTANPDLFKPTPVSPPQSGPVDEVDALYRNPSPNNQNSQGKSGGKKWQPLTSVAPHPEPDDHDPFSLGDSDDEDHKAKDTNPEDTDRLKKAAQSKEASTAGPLKPAERSGSIGQKDAAAEALLRDAK
ncbi:ubiquitin-binding protein cue5 [Neocucurbitaria cava]|uniref:Ubiquitin-binding protein cue5 n=1 Tax=Neocucurbitaria cava TaxID=798079 RepID=A0A9W8Y8N3_9PLEO|nr:ubiquitin-binding protein cue5 [Neocucurbitaria cava]